MRAPLDLAALAARLPPRPRTRFAPAPTGALHLGHVVNAIYVWGLARALGGEVVLRVEDHDRQRCRPAFERGLLDDLDWLGFEPDHYPTHAFRAGACEGRQQDREGVYREAVGRLVADGLIYGCTCTRKQIEEAGGTDTTELRYPGTCRAAGHPLDEGVGWRLRLDDRLVRFEDGRLGAQAQAPAAQCGDVLVRDRLGNWTYQFAVAVDDMAQDVALVVRGMDLLPSTGRQILMAELLGRHVPAVFVHHPLVMKSPSAKLSKSDGDTGVTDLRQQGWTPAAVIGAAAARVGLLSAPRALAARDVSTLFSA
ncbi:MAG: glutamate--tRNA ligase family protein [Vicinamibacterales bacterium]|nr:glutamate--tRNA ligase family protein [Vicinamibacterales bacterium]